MATLFFLGLEALVAWQLPHPLDYLKEFFQAQPELIRHTGVSLHHLGWIPQLLQTGLLGLLLLTVAYLLEKKLQLFHRTYTHLQRTYPVWYRAWPAAWRELLLVLLLWSSIAGLFLSIKVFFPEVPFELIKLEIFWFFFCFGLSLIPLKRYQTLQREDRPEKPTQAFIHHWKPDFSLQYALLIGQIYVRLLLPFFCLFVLLIPALELGYLELTTAEYGTLLGSIFTGLSLAWLLLRESNLDSAYGRENFSAVCLRILLAGIFLLIGTFSENYLLLLMFSTFAGLTAGSY